MWRGNLIYENREMEDERLDLAEKDRLIYLGRYEASVI
jgi:hypothetical protein